MNRSALAAAAVVALAACNPKAPSTVSTSPSASAGATPSPVALRISGHGTEKRPVRFVETKNNRKQFDILTRSFQSKGAAGAAMLTYNDVKTNFFAQDGSVLTATAPQASVDQHTNFVTMSGGVHAKNSAGVTLDCDTLTYDRATEMIHGDGHVVITNPNGFRATGNHVDSNVALTDAKMQ